MITSPKDKATDLSNLPHSPHIAPVTTTPPPSTTVDVVRPTDPHTTTILHDAHLGHVPGVNAIGVHCGIKRRKKDLTVITAPRGTTCAGVFTKNKVVAAPVTLTRDTLASNGGQMQAIVCVSGNANAITGEQGTNDAHTMRTETAEALDVPLDQVLVSATGVIGELLPMDRVNAGIHDAAGLVRSAPPDGSAAEAIMTTDTRTKEIVLRVDTPAGSFHIGGIAKGSGMIEPKMATMLAFVATDARVRPTLMEDVLHNVTTDTYNMISVDKETSTNDMALAFATGKSGLVVGADIPVATFKTAMHQVNLHLAKEIARDGEGATKLITVEIGGAPTSEEARLAAKAIVNSPLVKTAIHGEDPNWGRILAAIGYSGAAIDPETTRLAIASDNGEISLVEHGEPLAFDRAQAVRVLEAPEVRVIADLGLGDAAATAYGCDLTREYVDINAHYHT